MLLLLCSARSEGSGIILLFAHVRLSAAWSRWLGQVQRSWRPWEPELMGTPAPEPLPLQREASKHHKFSLLFVKHKVFLGLTFWEPLSTQLPASPFTD